MIAATDKKTVRVVTPPPSLDKFESQYQRVFEEKLNSALLPAQLTVKVIASDEGRRDSIMNAIILPDGS